MSIRVGVRGERGGERLDARGPIESPAAARWPPKRSRCSGAGGERPVQVERAATERPEPFHSPSLPAISTTGRS